jgi:hypothetical protein
MERQNFEDNLKKAFEEAEVSPTDNVWTNIELDLAKAESVVMKRRLAFYKMLAAASVVFALSAVGMNLYFLKGNAPLSGSLTNITSLPGTETRADKTTDAVTNEKNTSDANSATSNEIIDSKAENFPATSPIAETEKPVSKEKAGSLLQLTRNFIADQKLSTPVAEREKKVADVTESVAVLGETNLASLRPPHQIAFRLPEKQDEVDPVASMMARLERREMVMQQEEKKKDKKSRDGEKLWTSVGFAAGPFNSVTASALPHARSAPSNYMTSNTSFASKEAKASGIAYSMGVNMGTKLSERWVLQGGVNYLSQSSDYTAQAAIGTSDFLSFRPASINELEKLNSADAQTSTRVVTTAPYNVNNNVSYLSVPIQAGYLILNKKIGVQVNGGVATDLFLYNNKTADGDNLDEINQGRGDNDSPYRPLNFSGLVGTEISYRFGQRYRVALNPGLRLPFNSIYKSDLGIQSTPLTFDLGLRFRYIFH